MGGSTGWAVGRAGWTAGAVEEKLDGGSADTAGDGAAAAAAGSSPGSGLTLISCCGGAVAGASSPSTSFQRARSSAAVGDTKFSTTRCTVCA